MSGLHRSDTVSKSSGPIHLNSYALRGVPIKYKPPIFIPELMVLPGGWRLPAMPSMDAYRYDYSVERGVVDHARMRALSVAAEASMEARRIRQLEEAKRAQPRPAVPFTGLTILTPTLFTPVTPPATATAAAAACGNSSSSDSEREGGAEGSGVGVEGGGETNRVQSSSNEDASRNLVQPLGELSIKEFENYNNDPFEIASLQAINDMEVLQSVLQPRATSPTPAPAASTKNDTTSQQPALIVTSQSSRHSNSPVTNDLFGVATSGSSPTNTAVHQSHPVIAGATVFTVNSTNPFSLITPTAEPIGSYPNPFLPLPPPSETNHQPVDSNNPFASSQPPPPTRSSSEPGVATLIDITGSQANHSASHQTQVVPIPKPRTRLPNTTTAPAAAVAATATANPQTLLPPPSSSSSSSSGFSQSTPLSSSPSNTTVVVAPPIPPKPGQVAVSSAPLGGSPPIPPRTLQQQQQQPPRRGSTGSPPKAAQPPNLPMVHTRMGLGVAVLPPIPQKPLTNPPVTTSTSSQAPPPAYQHSPPPSSARRVTPPPPYFQEEGRDHTHQSGPHPPQQQQQQLPTAAVTAQQRPSPVPRRRAFKLPDPSSGLSATEKGVVSSITEIGFPAPRVARAVKRCGSDQTKIVNFLIVVAGLEEQHFNGDSAELALVVCNEDSDKALEYLKKVDQYKEIGFSEKDIHDAYKSSGSDWDKALDVLMQAR